MGFLRLWFGALFDGIRDPDERPLYAVAGGLLLGGTVFYALVEDWTLLDALYFSVVTLTTVGLGDYAPETDIGKAFTIFYVLAGVAVILAFANSVLARADRLREQRRRGRLDGTVIPDQEG
jgi:voltage-gated potassium channel